MAKRVEEQLQKMGDRLTALRHHHHGFVHALLGMKHDPVYTGQPYFQGYSEGEKVVARMAGEALAEVERIAEIRANVEREGGFGPFGIEEADAIDMTALFRDIALALYIGPSGLEGADRTCSFCSSGSAAHYCPPRQEARQRLHSLVENSVHVPPSSEAEEFADFYGLDVATLPARLRRG